MGEVTTWVYPRIALAHAQRQVEAIRSAYAEGGVARVRNLASPDHPAKTPVETGGSVAQPGRLSDIRTAILGDLASWMDAPDPVATISRDTARFDIALGRSLYERLDIIHSDAAHLETWNFLSLVLLPDVTVARWPALHPDRVLGSPSKHAMQRLWIRERVLGDILDLSSPKPLGEDELFQLFDRTALARNHRLVRVLASAVIGSRATKRMEWARSLYKRITFLTGARLMDSLSDAELTQLVAAEAATVPGTSSTPRLKVRLPADSDEARLTEAVVAAWNAHADYAFVDGAFEVDMAEYGTAEAVRRLSARVGDGDEHPFVVEVRSIVRDPVLGALVTGR
ncbi:hypothetical protein FBY23_0274 [Nocardioides sp. SLBN-35]|nr:hypothetical protein FBY23_0274 [Nocardioides sp. SLBN-35]